DDPAGLSVPRHRTALPDGSGGGNALSAGNGAHADLDMDDFLGHPDHRDPCRRSRHSRGAGRPFALARTASRRSILDDSFRGTTRGIGQVRTVTEAYDEIGPATADAGEAREIRPQRGDF